MNESYSNSVRNTVLSSKPSIVIRLLLMVLFVCLFSNVVGAQTASSTWSLTSSGNRTNVGNVTATTATIGAGIDTAIYSSGSGISTSGWANDSNNLVSNEYYEFKVTPNANTIFNVTAINFEHSTSNGNWKVQAYYSTDGFITSTPVTTAFNSNSTTPTANNNTVNIDVESSTLSVRIYGWESDGSGRSLRIKNVVISGTTCAKPVIPGAASADSATCSGFTAKWGYSNYTTAYFIDVATNSSFSPATIVPAYNNLNVGNILSLALTGLNPGTTYFYRVRASNSCGTSLSSSTMNYATSPFPTVAPVAKAPSNIQCYYVQLNFSTGSNVTGVYLDIARDSGFADFLPEYNNYNVAYNNGSIPVSNLPAGTLYYRIRGYNGCGVTANSNTISFSTPSPIGGDISPAQRICSGTSPANLTLTGYTTTNTEILRWEKSSDAAFTNPIAITGTTSTLSGATIGNLTVNTYFRAVVRNKFDSWCESFSNPVLVSISSTPIITPNKVDETCPVSNNGTITPTLSGGLTNVRYIKLTQKHADHQQVAEIQAFQIFTGTNIALSSVGAVATSSSVFSSDYPVSEVNDGITATNGNMWHSSTTNINEWVQIDLQSGKNIDYLRIHNRTDCCQSRGQNMLLELFDASNNLVYSKTINLWEGVNGAHYVDVNVLDVSWADDATTLNRTGLDSGIYTLNYADASGCNAINYPITLGATNLSPSTPTVTPTQPTCTVATGAITVNTPLAATGITYTVTGTNPVVAAVTNATGVFSDLSAGTYDVTTTNACGTSTATSVTLEFVTNTWNGSAWSNGTPNSNQKIVFSGNYPPAPPAEDLDGDIITGCSCMVTGNTKVVIKSGKTLVITNEVTVVGTGSLTFENNASLVQINNAAVNSGNITYNRVTITQVRNTDYTYWSTPVSPLKLAGVGGIAYSSIALTGSIFYSYLVTSTTEGWKSESASTQMITGQGYGIRGPGAIATTPVGFLGVSFTGVPNNGNYSIPIAKTNASYLLGNPYPSAIDADAFLTDNSAVLDGTLYFWTHNSVIQDRNNIISTAGTGAYAYTSDDYAAYNKTGGTASALSDPSNPPGKIPTGKIAAGQGFFATSSVASGNIVFNNAMRLISNAPINNTQFFKTKSPKEKTATTIEKNRVWLNMTNKEGAFKQTLVGYVTDATNDYDSRFDGESLDGNDFIDFYSINEDKNLVIQGRALPFDEKDEVTLGYKTTIEGDFTINIDEVDGLLTNQSVFLEDKLTNTVVDLKAGNYTFNTAAGTFDDRFVLKYSSKTLSVDEADKEDGILVLYSNNYKTLIIQNKIVDATVNSVSLFNMSGQNIAVWSVKQWEEQTNLQIPIKNLSSGIYIVIVKTTKGESRKKIIVN